jgi:hypothetical protein
MLMLRWVATVPNGDFRGFLCWALSFSLFSFSEVLLLARERLTS